MPTVASRARTSSPDGNPTGEPRARGHAAEHVDGQALTGDHGSQDGQPQDGLDQPLHAPGQIGQPDGGDSHRDRDMENREAKTVTSKVNRFWPYAATTEKQDQDPAH